MKRGGKPLPELAKSAGPRRIAHRIDPESGGYVYNFADEAPSVGVEPPAVLRVFFNNISVDMLPDDRFLIVNNHGRAELVLESGAQRVEIGHAEPTIAQWLELRVGRVHGHEPLVVSGDDGTKKKGGRRG